MKYSFFRTFALLSLLSTSLLMSCKKDDFKPEESYIKIYNDSEGNKKYTPLGIQQTSDQGFLILSAFNGWRINVMKIDKEGSLLWSTNLPSNYVNATPNILKYANKYYLVCMDNVGLFTYLMNIDEGAGSVNQIQNFSGILYPTAAFSNGSAIYIQNYDRLAFKTGIHQLSTSLTSIANSGEVNILTDVEDKVVGHIMYTGKRMPFFISTTPENDYIIMNGFNNYSFSLIFLDPNLLFTGVYNGAGFNGGVSSLLPLGGSKFSVARFSFDNLYMNPATNLNPTGIDITESISANGMSELNPDKPVIIRAVKVGGTNYVTLAASTRSNQLLLCFFDANSGALKGKKYIGKNTPYTISDLVSTEDNGLMILTQVKVMGSYDRIATIRLSNEQLEESIE